MTLPDQPDSLGEILAYTHDSSLDIVRAALRRLAAQSGEREADDLRARMLEVDPALVGDFAATLAAIGDREAPKVAAEALRDKHPPRRLAAARALAVLATPAEGPQLVGALGDSLAAVRRAALVALRRIGEREHGAACAELLDDADPQVRAAAVPAVAALVDDPGPLLDSVRRADAPEVRVAVAAHLPILDQTVARVLLTDDEPAVREAAVRAAGTERAGMLALILEGDRVVDVRVAAARRLGELGEAGPAPDALVDGLTDRSPMVRIAALESLEKALGRERAVERLVEAMRSEEEEMRRGAVYALARLEASEAEQALAVALGDPDREVRLAAVQCGAQLFGSAWEPLTRLVEDPDPAVNHAVLMARDRAGREAPS